MKTTIILIASLILNFTNLKSQTYQVRLADEPNFKSSINHTRVTGYYEDGYGANATWQTISLKVSITTDRYGKDEVTVTAYKKMNSDYWTDVSFATVRKTYGDIAKEFSYYVYVASTTVYFTI